MYFYNEEKTCSFSYIYVGCTCQYVLILQNLVYFFDINLFLKGIHQIRKETATKDNEYRCPDPIPRLAKELAEESWLLCFDEVCIFIFNYLN